jgi:integrase
VGRQGTRRRLDRGIYQDASGVAIQAQVHGVRQELRFPPDTDLPTLQQRRDQLRADLHDVSPLQARGTLSRDAERYLKQIAGRPGSKADRSHLRAWIDRLGPKPRSRITADDVRLALAAWRTAGTWTGGRGKRPRQATARPASEKTLKERWRVLRHLYKTLDGPKARTPCDDVLRPKPAAPTPVGVPVTTVQKVATALATRAAGTPRHSLARQDYARFLLLTTTGQRPAQIMRAIAADFHLREQFWIVRGAKGGPTHAIHLNAEMRAAVRRFLASAAVGRYNDQQLLAVVRAHGWPATIPLYNARHSIETTRRFYAGILRLRQRQVGRRLEGRLIVR